MTTVAETALTALFAALPTPPSGAKLRNVAAPPTIPSGGLLILRDGTRGAPIEEYLNPPSGVYRHAAQLQLMVQGTDDAARTSAIDALAALVQAALAAARTLGDTVDYAQLQRGDGRDDTEEGTTPIRIEEATVILEYLEEL